MDKLHALYSLIEWDLLAARGEVEEPPFDPFRPSTGIGCPNFIGETDHVCGAHLWDINGILEIQGQERRWVGCHVCGWLGSRRVGVKAKGK